MSKEIECIIEEDGTIKIDLLGYKGKGCAQVVDQIAKSLGIKIEEKTKAEFYQAETTQQTKLRRF